MSDMPDSTPDQSEQPAAQPLAEPIPYELVHAHDHPELVSDVVLNTDSPDIILSKKALENEGGKLESAYVIEETVRSEAEFAASDSMPSATPDTLPESIDAWTRAGEPAFEEVSDNQAFRTFETAEANVPLEDTEPIEPLAKPLSLNEWRLQELNNAVERYPNTPTNYVLRGEVYLALNQQALAAADFNHALALADARLEQLPWGYATAAFIDRARTGLRRVRS